jgi:hypothetical protein
MDSYYTTFDIYPDSQLLSSQPGSALSHPTAHTGTPDERKEIIDEIKKNYFEWTSRVVVPWCTRIMQSIKLG